MDRISVFGDVEIFLDDTPHVGEERPVGTNSAAIFIRQSDIVGANRDKPAIGNLELTMELIDALLISPASGRSAQFC